MFILAAVIFSNERRFYKIYPCVKVPKTGIHYFKFQSSRLFPVYQVEKKYDYDSFFIISEDINLNITVTEVILKNSTA